MKIGLIENVLWGSKLNRVDGIRLAAEIGFNVYDVYTTDLTPQLKSRMKAALSDTDVSMGSLLVLCYSLTDFNQDVRRFSIGWLKEQIDRGHDLGPGVVVLALGEYIQEKSELDPNLEWGWAVEGVRDVADHAQNLGIRGIQENAYIFGCDGSQKNRPECQPYHLPVKGVSVEWI